MQNRQAFYFVINFEIMSALTELEIRRITIASRRDGSTKGFKVACPQLNVYDIKASLNFYCNILGMKLLKKLDIPQGEFSDYFLGYLEEDESVPSKGSPEETIWAMTKARTIDLRHNWKRSTPYEIGSGFSNISILVPDVYAACKKFEELGVTFLKRPDEGGITGLAIISDPDGYAVELYSVQTIKDNCI